jgi:dinuclear metal center YbgI/SA1388 family protein
MGAMTTKQTLMNMMQDWAPEHVAESWDNVGLQLDTQRDIRRVAVALEINSDTWPIIEAGDYDCIITHHPFLFKPLSRVGYSWTDRVLRTMIQRDMGLYVSHTNLDRVPTGVSHALMRQYNLSPESVRDLVDGYGKVAVFSHPVALADLEEAVPVAAMIMPNNTALQSIAFVGGSGKSFVGAVMDKGVDVFITGELGYHELQYFRQENVGVILLGHYQSEVFILDDIRDRCQALGIHADVIG